MKGASIVPDSADFMESFFLRFLNNNKTETFKKITDKIKRQKTQLNTTAVPGRVYLEDSRLLYPS
jgi:hypothetical protein